ncbi:solute carrier family 22 member 6-like [Macrobrachium rosenbergii]|uniref:solute carrier family 22 member 6-like n=1 Tax=Macrobrachium rosenbergii TaxID=79674 RepID=UPI0034D3A578
MNHGDVINTQDSSDTETYTAIKGASFAECVPGNNLQFLGVTPNYWCHIGPLVDANWTQHQIVSLSMPHGNGSPWDGCTMNNYNYTKAAEIGYNASIENPGSIAIAGDNASWDLVCERRALYSTTQAATQAGSLIASLVFGYFLAVERETYLSSSCPHLLYFSDGTLLTELSDDLLVGTLFVMPWAFGYMLIPAIAYFIRPWRWLRLRIPFRSFSSCRTSGIVHFVLC